MSNETRFVVSLLGAMAIMLVCIASAKLLQSNLLAILAGGSLAAHFMRWIWRD